MPENAVNLGFPEVIVILVVILLVFGPNRLPELSRAVGRGMSEFRKAMRDLESTIESEVDEARDAAKLPEVAQSAAPSKDVRPDLAEAPSVCEDTRTPGASPPAEKT